MAVDFLLEVDGIKGESEDHKHKDTIELSSWSFGATQSGSMAHGGGGGTGKATVHDLTFVSTHVSKASMPLFTACATGQHIKKATLYVRKAGKEAQEYMVIKLTDIVVSSYQTGGHGGDQLPADQFTFNFAKIEGAYKPQKADGTLGPAIEMSFDVKSGKAT
jgi:type VI secretion system secreted protein Hcp